MATRRRQLVRAQREQHRAGPQVGRDGFTVGVPAVAADELHRMVQPGQPHRDVQGAAADVGLDTGGALDNINQALTNNCEHAHTLPENTARRRCVRACSACESLSAGGPARNGGHVHQDSGCRGVVESGIDVDHVPAGALQEARGDAGPVAGAAVHPELPGGDVIQPRQQFMERDVDAPATRDAGVFVGAPHVQDGVPRRPAGRARRPSPPRIGGEGGAGRQRMRLRADGGVRGVDAEPGEVADGLFDVAAGAHEGQLLSPRQDPAQVGAEAVAVFEAHAARRWLLAKATRRRRSTTHSPSSSAGRAPRRPAIPARPGPPGPAPRRW